MEKILSEFLLNILYVINYGLIKKVAFFFFKLIRKTIM